MSETAVLTKEQEEVLKVNEEVEGAITTDITFEISTDLLRNLIGHVERSTSRLAVQDIMKGIYIYVEDDKITLRAINGEFGTEIQVPQEEVIEGKKRVKNFEITDGKPGGGVLMTKNIKAMINKLPRKRATITIKGTTALIKSGSTKYNLLILDAAQFPSFPSTKKAVSITLSPEQLSDMYARTAYAISSKDSQVPLMGLLHQIKDGKLTLIATDRHQLSRSIIDLDDEYKKVDQRVSIPAKSIDEIRKQLKSTKTVSIHFIKGNVLFEFDNGVTSSRVIEGDYPDAEKMIPKQFTSELRFYAKDVYDMIDRSLLLCEGTTATASLRAIPELRQMRLTSQEDGVGFFEEDIASVESAGAAIHIGVNLRFIVESLKTYAPGELLKLQFIGHLKPFIVSRAEYEDDPNLNLVLPVRLTAYDKEVEITEFNAPLQIEADYDYSEVEDAVEENEAKAEGTSEIEAKEETPVVPEVVKEAVVAVANNPFAQFDAVQPEEPIAVSANQTAFDHIENTE